MLGGLLSTKSFIMKFDVVIRLLLSTFQTILPAKLNFVFSHRRKCKAEAVKRIL